MIALIFLTAAATISAVTVSEGSEGRILVANNSSRPLHAVCGTFRLAGQEQAVRWTSRYRGFLLEQPPLAPDGREP